MSGSSTLVPLETGSNLNKHNRYIYISAAVQGKPRLQYLKNKSGYSVGESQNRGLCNGGDKIGVSVALLLPEGGVPDRGGGR